MRLGAMYTIGTFDVDAVIPGKVAALIPCMESCYAPIVCILGLK